MEERNIHKMMLEQHAKRLHLLSGQMNLYVCLCCKEHSPNRDRLKTDVQTIMGLAMNIETEIAYLDED